jgi:hypothetical protein
MARKFAELADMRRLLPLTALAAIWLVEVTQTTTSHIHYYVQLIRAADSSRPPQAGSRPVGAKLATSFHGALRWEHYWEICRREVDVPLGSAVNLHLPNQRAVEIDLSRPGKRTTVAFQKGKPVGRIVAPMGEGFTLIGGDRDDSTAWFIVVRRDKPGA